MVRSGTLAEKKRENVGIFPKWGTPPLPPVWECHVFEKKKIWFILHFRTLETFIVGGSPMLKTVKNGSGIWVDPPWPCSFKIPTFYRIFFGGGRPSELCKNGSTVWAYSPYTVPF